ncbi:hypothetical protein [Streptomyces sp. NPDC002057]|uniref:hypothetical protein n=1 Tax=Streptomyces sp. NPDC002057 TaxID=3154664 RepID=UPI0033172500
MRRMDIKTTEKTDGAETAENAEKVERTESAEKVGKSERADARTEGADPLDAREGEPTEDLVEDDEDDEELSPESAPASAGLGGAAAAVVSAALGAVALTGTWTGKIVAERETLIGQIKTSGAGTPTQQISEIYGDAWHSTALVNGVFAFVALFVAVLVLVLPGRPTWVRAVAVAGVALGALGLLLSVVTYFDLFLSLPTAGS